jgi:hypothetical protein
MKLFRTMREDTDGMPILGMGSRTLGIRPGNMLTPDVDAVNPTDIVVPGDGGVSVTPDDPANLPYPRRPMSLGGKGRDPVWYIEADDLTPTLQSIPDSPIHGAIEVSGPMSLQEFQDAVAATRSKWRIHCR